MNTIIEQFQDKINGTFSFFDRMIIKGHIRQFFSLSGKKHFLSYNNVLLMDFSAYAAQVTDSIVSHVEALTTSLGRPLVYLYFVNRGILFHAPTGEAAGWKTCA